LDQPPPSPHLLDQVRNAIRRKHYGIRTEQAYGDWIRRFIHFHGKRHPAALGADQVAAFPTHLAVELKVAAAAQNQAKAAVLFLYREVSGLERRWLDGVAQARVPARLPAVLTRDEVSRVLARLTGVHHLIAELLTVRGCASWRACACGRRRGLRWRRDPRARRQGMTDRITMRPARIAPALRAQLAAASDVHDAGRANG
jgi:hypothetical protein